MVIYSKTSLPGGSLRGSRPREGAPPSKLGQIVHQRSVLPVATGDRLHLAPPRLWRAPPPQAPLRHRPGSGGWQSALAGALLTMILDIIIDPLTVRGDRWFLGRIYYYPHGGPYFGVPLSNFAGWFLVPLLVIKANQIIWKIRERLCRGGAEGEGYPERAASMVMMPPGARLRAAEARKPKPTRPEPSSHRGRLELLGALFYTAIAAFNIVITFAIGQWRLGLASLGWVALIGLFIILSDTVRRRRGGPWERHPPASRSRPAAARA
ncbi:MAG: carotenoid biosynthesis protein [Deltaproteobacteria bacterium]|nr:carotenoid biosynthesis protein [Deltaproteobacteria bacterium]